MSALSHFRTGTCEVCGARKARGFHLEEWCPDEDKHAADDAQGDTRYVLLTRKHIFRRGDLVTAHFDRTLENARARATTHDQIWAAVKAGAFYELREFIEFGGSGQ